VPRHLVSSFLSSATYIFSANAEFKEQNIKYPRTVDFKRFLYLGLFPIFICDTGLPQYLLQQAYVDLSAAVRIGNANFLPSLYHELMLSTRKWA